MKKKLHFHPYKMSVVQELFPQDAITRVNYCHWFNANIRNDDVLDVTFFSDEAWIHLSGYINSQNYRTWASQNPHNFVATTLHPQKLGIWVAMSRRRIIGPIIFRDTLNAANYRQLILQPFIDQLHDDELQRGFFQQDGATPHTANETITYLQQFFDDRIISRGRWPPRSPDLTPLDYFLFGQLKNEVFKNRIHTLEDLEVAIIHVMQNITPDILQNVFENMKRRVDICLQNNGGHFEHMM